MGPERIWVSWKRITWMCCLNRLRMKPMTIRIKPKNSKNFCNFFATGIQFCCFLLVFYDRVGCLCLLKYMSIFFCNLYADSHYTSFMFFFILVFVRCLPICVPCFLLYNSFNLSYIFSLKQN